MPSFLSTSLTSKIGIFHPLFWFVFATKLDCEWIWDCKSWRGTKKSRVADILQLLGFYTLIDWLCRLNFASLQSVLPKVIRVIEVSSFALYSLVSTLFSKLLFILQRDKKALKISWDKKPGVDIVSPAGKMPRKWFATSGFWKFSSQSHQCSSRIPDDTRTSYFKEQCTIALKRQNWTPKV